MNSLISMIATRETDSAPPTSLLVRPIDEGANTLDSGTIAAVEGGLAQQTTSQLNQQHRKLRRDVSPSPLLVALPRAYHKNFANERQLWRNDHKSVEKALNAACPPPAARTEMMLLNGSAASDQNTPVTNGVDTNGSHEERSPVSRGRAQGELSCSRQTVVSENSELLVHLGMFEARKLIALRRMGADRDLRDVGITAQELRVVHLLASVDNGQRRPNITCTVDTKNFRLQWLLNPASFSTSSSASRCSRVAELMDVTPSLDSVTQVDGGDDSAESPIHHDNDVSQEHRCSTATNESVMIGRLNLLTMPTDVLVAARGKPSPKDLHRPLLDSPRSVVVCLRNGVQPMDLQVMPFAAAVLEWSAEGGYTTDMIRERHQFQETMRSCRLESLQAEYRVLCEKISTESILTFFEFLALNDGLQAPELVAHHSAPTDGSSSAFVDHYEVRVSGDPKATEAIKKIEEKSRHDREKLTTILRQEISNAAKKAEAFAEVQRKNTEKEVAHRRERSRLEKQRAEAAAVKRSEAESKAHRRLQLVEAAMARRKEEVEERQRRAEEQERISEQAVATRIAQRRARHEAKQAAQLERLQLAELRLQAMEEERRERFAEKERLRDALLKQKQFLLEQKRLEDEEANEEIQERRRSIAQRAAEITTDRLVRAQRNSEMVEARLQQFANEKHARREFTHLVELRRELNREEVFQESERQQQEAVNRILERREAHESSFQSFKDTQDAKRKEMKAHDVQLLLIKEMELSRHEQVRSYELLLAAEACERKRRKAQQLDEAREAEQVVLEQERESLHQLRRKALMKAASDRVDSERSQYFEVVRITDPSPSTQLKAINARHVALMKASQGRPLTMEEEASLQRHRRLAQSASHPPASPSPLPDISAIRPSSSLQ